MAVGFIVLAAFRIGRKVVVDRLTAILMITSFLVTLFIRAPWVFPAVLLAGGIAALVASGEKSLWNRVAIDKQWIYLVILFVFAFGLLLGTFLLDVDLVHLAESFYRYGYLVFGGGQVVVPVMHSELVELRGYMTDSEFLTGYGFAQGIPGPMFSFAAYAGGMAARGSSWIMQVQGPLSRDRDLPPRRVADLFVYPVWAR